MTSSLASIYAVWLRYFAVFRKNWIYGLVTTFVEPFLYLASFGFGLGSLIGKLNAGGTQISYRAFVFSGIVAQAVLFQAFFEAAYGSFIRMYYQRIFQAISVTPVTLSEVLWGEIAWDATRATLSATAVLALGVAIGDFNLWGALILIPLAYCFSLIFAGLGLLVAAKAKTIESISYPQYLLIFPMFLFCGVFFPISRLPGALRIAAWFFPLTPVISLIRTLILGFPLDMKAPVLVVAWILVLVPLARRSMRQRLVH